MPARTVPEKFQVAFSFAGEERDLVRAIAEAVEGTLGRAMVFFDEWYAHYLPGPDGDLKLQKIYGEQSELVVVCVSRRYGEKVWTLTENEAIRARFMKIRASLEQRDKLRVFPIRVGDGDVEGIPFNAIVPDARERPPAEIAQIIVDRLRLIVPDASGGNGDLYPSWPKEPVPFKHGLADRAKREWPALLQLLTADSVKRILMFHGPSGFSKSAVLRAAAKYAKGLNAPIAYVDFNDTKLLDEANVLRELQSGLARALPGFALLKEPDRWTLRTALRGMKGSALILLDSYEKTAHTEKLVGWIETYLLPEVEDCEHLRFVIGGQNELKFGGTRWGDRAEAVVVDRIHDQHIWKDWVHEINPNVDETTVAAFVKGLEGMPADISTTLKTLAENLAPRVPPSEH